MVADKRIEIRRAILSRRNSCFFILSMEQKKIKLAFERINGKTFLVFEVSPGLEKIYKQQSEAIRESQSWEGLKFYSIPKLIESASYKNVLSKFNLFDDYGSGFQNNSRFNIAFLRTVGGKGKIAISSGIGFAELTQMTRNTISFLKEYHREFLADFKIKGELTVEI